MEKVLLSACLLGQKVRYNGRSLGQDSSVLLRWLTEERVVSVCPEVDGGMEIPRAPAEIREGCGADVLTGLSMVTDLNGRDVTSFFIRGAESALSLCRENNIKIAVLADGSPSCGSALIYNGRFEGIKKEGAGVTATLLRQKGIQVFSQHSFEEAERALSLLNKE